MSRDWLAGLVVQGLFAEGGAVELAYALAYGLTRRAYNVDRGGKS